MKGNHKLEIYNTIATLNESHHLSIVQNKLNNKIYVKKILDVYNIDVYKKMFENQIPGLPRIIELYEDNSRLVLIEEYISGRTLQEMIETGDISAENVISYSVLLCDTVEKLHNQNPPIIHRDIKPSNIIITSSNYPVLLDFNAAKLYSEASESDTVLLGTPGYAAPEQYGFGCSSVQTDIYTIGIVMQEMIASCGRIHLSPLEQTLFDSLAPIIKKCTSMEPAFRYKSSVELREAIIKVSSNFLDLDRFYNINRTVSFLSFHSQGDSYSLLPPGFRSRKPWKMILSSICYIAIFALGMSLDVENSYGIKLWIDRFTFILIMLSLVFIGFDYQGVQNAFRLCKHKNRVLHYVGIVLFDTAVAFLQLVLAIFIEAVIS